MKRYYTIAFFLLLSFSGKAQSIELLKKLPVNSQITSFQSYNSSLFFAYNKGLWKTDGDSNSTTLVKQFAGDIKNMLLWNGKLYFIADDGQSGWELWRSNGTLQGTQVVKDINPGSASSFMTYNYRDKLTVCNNWIYFRAEDGIHGRELWKTDGTSAGTNMVIDLNTTFGYFGYDGLYSNIATANNQLFFTATDSFRLWVSDGTASGTRPTNLIVNREFINFDDIFYEYNNKVVLFGVNTNVNSADFGRAGLFSTDGTDTGTQLVYDSLFLLTDTHTIMNNKLYFLGRKRFNTPGYCLYATDGTTAGTNIIKETVISSVGGNITRQLYVYNNQLYFADAGSQTIQLWKSDGTAQGTQQLTSFSHSLKPCQFLVANGLLYFKGIDTNHVELWSTDGTAGNTKVVEALGTNNLGAQLVLSLWSPIYQYNNYLFFGNFYNADTVYSLYKYQLYPDAIANVPNIAKTEVYPNPAQDFIYYKGEVQSMVAYDINGKQVAQGSSNRLDISAFAPGAYFVLIVTAKGTQFARFIKE